MTKQKVLENMPHIADDEEVSELIEKEIEKNPSCTESFIAMRVSCELLRKKTQELWGM